MLSLSNPMKIQEHMPAFPFDRMPWFQKLHDQNDLRKCMEVAQKNWWTFDAGIREWIDESGGGQIGQRYCIYPRGEYVRIRIELNAPDCIPSPMRNYEPLAITSCSVINSLQKDLRRIFADALCIKAVQNMEMARSTLVQPGDALSPDQDNSDVIEKFTRGLNNKSYGEMCSQIAQWEENLRDLYEAIVDCRLGVSNDR